jgi:hypothetical protein
MGEVSAIDSVATILNEMAKTAAVFNGALATLKFNNPASAEAAIKAMEAAIDAKFSPFYGNPDIKAFAGRIKAAYRAQVMKKLAMVLAA